MSSIEARLHKSVEGRGAFGTVSLDRFSVQRIISMPSEALAMSVVEPNSV